MSVRIKWTLGASLQLKDMHEYISIDSSEAADRQIAIVLNAADSLAGFPEKGRPGRRRGTRELVVSGTPYILAYRIRLATVEVLAVIHGARRWPRDFTLV